jgi:3-hydroxyacyl-CoA dehydrogenase
MRWGFGMERGPFEGWDLMGVARVVERMEKDGLEGAGKGEKDAGRRKRHLLQGRKRQALLLRFRLRKLQAHRTSETMISLEMLKADNKVVNSAMLRPP